MVDLRKNKSYGYFSKSRTHPSRFDPALPGSGALPNAHRSGLVYSAPFRRGGSGRRITFFRVWAII